MCVCVCVCVCILHICMGGGCVNSMTMFGNTINTYSF